MFSGGDAERRREFALGVEGGSFPVSGDAAGNGRGFVVSSAFKGLLPLKKVYGGKQTHVEPTYGGLECGGNIHHQAKSQNQLQFLNIKKIITWMIRTFRPCCYHDYLYADVAVFCVLVSMPLCWPPLCFSNNCRRRKEELLRQRRCCGEELEESWTQCSRPSLRSRCCGLRRCNVFLHSAVEATNLSACWCATCWCEEREYKQMMDEDKGPTSRSGHQRRFEHHSPVLLIHHRLRPSCFPSSNTVFPTLLFHYCTCLLWVCRLPLGPSGRVGPGPL